MTDRRILDQAVKAIVREVAHKAAQEAGKAAMAEDAKTANWPQLYRVYGTPLRRIKK